MSLNRSEQILYDYIRRHPEERQYIHDKVQGICAGSSSPEGASSRIDSELWRYYEERSSFVPGLSEAAGPPGPRRISMKNLAEYLVRIWTEPRPRRQPRDGESGSAGGNLP
jgi:hypothetical protein